MNKSTFLSHLNKFRVSERESPGMTGELDDGCERWSPSAPPSKLGVRMGEGRKAVSVSLGCPKT